MLSANEYIHNFGFGGMPLWLWRWVLLRVLNVDMFVKCAYLFHVAISTY